MPQPFPVPTSYIAKPNQRQSSASLRKLGLQSWRARGVQSKCTPCILNFCTLRCPRAILAIPFQELHTTSRNCERSFDVYTTVQNPAQPSAAGCPITFLQSISSNCDQAATCWCRFLSERNLIDWASILFWRTDCCCNCCCYQVEADCAGDRVGPHEADRATPRQLDCREDIKEP